MTGNPEIARSQVEAQGGSPERWALGTLWLMLGLLKAAAPGTFVQHVAARFSGDPFAGQVFAWAIIGGELLLGAALLPVGRGGARVGPCGVSFLASLVVTATVFAKLDGPGSCGCFGALVQADRGQRLVVAGVLLFLGVRALRASVHHSRAKRVG